MSEARTAKVTEITDVRQWDGPKGTIYYHRLKMDNGDAGEIGKKKENAFRVGDSLTYTVEETSYGNKFKEIRDEAPRFGGASGRNDADMAKSVVLSYAKDVILGKLANGLYTDAALAGELPDLTAEIIDTATRFMNWYNGTDTVSVEEPTTSVVQGTPPEVEEQREYTNTPSPVSEAMQTRKKPDKGNAGKAPSAAQTTLLNKVCREHDIDIDRLATAEWPELDNASQLSSWAVSYLLDLLLKK